MGCVGVERRTLVEGAGAKGVLKNDPTNESERAPPSQAGRLQMLTVFDRKRGGGGEERLERGRDERV